MFHLLYVMLLSWIIFDCYVNSFNLLPNQLNVARTHIHHVKHQTSSLSLFNTNKKSPFLAIITETNACDSDEKVIETYETIQKAFGEKNDHGVDLISIRVTSDESNEFQGRIVDLAQRIMLLKENILTNHPPEDNQNEFVVVINDHIQAAIKSNVDGVHVKESKKGEMSSIRQALVENKINKGIINPKVIIGTSAHSIESALTSWKDHKPDYFFVGTCYLTQSHPEKDANDLEGPELPGMIKDSLAKVDCNDNDDDSLSSKTSPIIFAIGGIDEQNCHEPVNLGADGVAVIRGVMKASNPREAVTALKSNMNCK